MTNRQAAIEILKRLRRNGFEALLAGGCVRDMLLGRRAKDYDIATSARPEDVTKLFKRTLKVGAKFGVVIVLLDQQQVEVVTFRTETGYLDGRHPTKISFANAAEDASRRDFTINGMFYDPLEKEVIDYVDGRADLERKLLRTIGDPHERFGEDYLRMLRALRFSTQLGFDIELQTWSAICKKAVKITKISGERIRMELESILIDPNRAAGVKMVIESKLAATIFPGFAGGQADFSVNVLSRLRKKVDFPLGLAGLFAGCEDEFAIEKMQILKLSRNETKHAKFLLANRGKLLDEQMSLGRLRMILAGPYFRDLYELQRAIQRAGDKTVSPLIKLRKRIKALGDIELRPRPLLNGRELIRLGAVSGPAMGQLSEEMYIAQLEGKLQTKEQAEKWVSKWLQKHRVIE